MRLTRIAFALSLVAAAGAPRAPADEFVVLRYDDGGKLAYEVVPAGEAEAARARLEEAVKPAKRRVDSLDGTFPDDEACRKAIRRDQDEVGWFACWRCEGAGEVQAKADAGHRSTRKTSGDPTPKMERCKICRGGKRVRGDGYSILSVKLGTSWGYMFVRRGMISWIEEQVKAGNAALTQGGLGGSTEKPVIKAVQSFRPGQFDEASQLYERVQSQSDGKEGFLRDISIPTAIVPPVRWPSEFFTGPER